MRFRESPWSFQLKRLGQASGLYNVPRYYMTRASSKDHFLCVYVYEAMLLSQNLIPFPPPVRNTNLYAKENGLQSWIITWGDVEPRLLELMGKKKTSEF